jgi:hypothetical protein
MRKVVVVGSRSFPITPKIGAAVVELIQSYPPDTVILTRGSSGFDTFVMRACEIIGYPVAVFPSTGGGDNFRRDADMVRESDEVLVFMDPHSLVDMNTGTAHVVEKALDQKKPTKAYSVGNGGLVYVGSSD